jgi:hypothetical protein
MKATLDLPDDLYRRVKLHAVKSDRRLKDTVAQLIKSALRAVQAGEAAMPLPKPIKLKRGGPLTTHGIEAAIAAGHERLLSIQTSLLAR